jgi:anti-sigma factor RsiW
MTSHRIDDERLIAYALGELPPAEAEEVRLHLEKSPGAASMVARFREVEALLAEDDSVEPPIATVAAAKALFERLRESTAGSNWLRAALEAVDRVVGSLIFDSRVQPALAGLRGEQDRHQLSFESECGEVDLELEPSLERRSDRWRIMGQVSPRHDAGEVRVALVPAGAAAAAAETRSDSHGVFTLSAAPGRYDIIIEVAGKSLVLPGVTIP